MTAQVKAAIWTRVSTSEQDAGNQLPALRKLAHHRGLHVVKEYSVEASAYNGAHRAALSGALEDARHGEFDVLLVWALDRLTREGIEATLATMRRFRERGVLVISHEESWTDGPPEMQEILTAFFAWVAQMESKRRSERIKAGLERRKSEGKPIRRRQGSLDKKPRKRSGYIARYERERGQS
jgi:putative DNA-invertase from lambdoid prophage Rac